MHNIATDMMTGKAMVFTSGDLPWHKLGQNVSEAPTWEEAIKLAGLDWQVIEAPLYTKWSVSGDRKLANYKAIVRADTHEELGVHGRGYKIFQNADAFRFCDALMETGARYESAGALGVGERIWCLARIPQADYSIGDDKHETYLLVATSHDGSLSTTITVTDVRVVCQNTLTAALGYGNSKEAGKLKIKHTKAADDKMTAALAMVQGTIQTSSSLRDKLTSLAERKVTRVHVETILAKLFPATTDTAAANTRRDNVLSTVLSHFAHNDGNAFPEQKGTAYSLLNAITDYTDHDRGTRKTEGQTESAARGESALFGSGAKLKTSAMDLIYDVVMKDGSTVPMTMTVNDTSPITGDSGDLLDSIISETLSRPKR